MDLNKKRYPTDVINRPTQLTEKGRHVLDSKQRHYNFARIFRHQNVDLPGCFFACSPSQNSATSKHAGSAGKVKVILCIKPTPEEFASSITKSFANGALGHFLSSSQPLGSLSNVKTRTHKKCITIRGHGNQVTLWDQTPMRKRALSSAGKCYSLDGVHNDVNKMTDLCLFALTDTIKAVLRGQDSCVLTLGHKQTGKTTTMLGMDQQWQNVGVIPRAIAWLYGALNQQKESEGTRFAIRVSAVEISGADEKFKDLLANVASNDDICSPYHSAKVTRTTDCLNTSVSDLNSNRALSDASFFVKQFSMLNEVRATTMERAAALLDTALTNRTRITSDKSEGLSHMLFTLHVYQCRVESSDSGTNVYGGRAKLHLLDLGCGRYGHEGQSSFPSYTESEPSKFILKNRLGFRANPSTKSLSITGMASVILALLTGQRHLPYRDSVLTHLLKEALTGNQMQPCILAHVDSESQYFKETSQIVQLVSKISRLRRRRVGSSNATLPSAHDMKIALSTPENISNSFKTDCSRRLQSKRRLRGPRLGRSSYNSSNCSVNMDLDYSSSSEQSCDTVIYMGQDRRSQSFTKDQPLKLHLAKLGPRGTADGSVDLSSFSTGHASDTEPNSFAIPPRDRSKSSRSSDEDNSAGSRSVKRIMPRTNATAWPRSISSSQRRNMPDKLNETWIDGPEAKRCESQPNASEMNCMTGYPSVRNEPSVCENYAEHTDCSSVHESVYVRNRPANKTDCINYPVDVKSDNHNTAQGNRALSDISEHTEEADNVHDGNTIHSPPADGSVSLHNATNFDPRIFLDSTRMATRNLPQIPGKERELPSYSREKNAENLYTEKNKQISFPQGNINSNRCQHTTTQSNQTKRNYTRKVPSPDSLADKLIESLKGITGLPECQSLRRKQQCNPLLMNGCGEQTMNALSLGAIQNPEDAAEVHKIPILPTFFCQAKFQHRTNSSNSCIPNGEQELHELPADDVALRRVAEWVNAIGINANMKNTEQFDPQHRPIDHEIIPRDLSRQVIFPRLQIQTSCAANRSSTTPEYQKKTNDMLSTSSCSNQRVDAASQPVVHGPRRSNSLQNPNNLNANTCFSLHSTSCSPVARTSMRNAIPNPRATPSIINPAQIAIKSFPVAENAPKGVTQNSHTKENRCGRLSLKKFRFLTLPFLRTLRLTRRKTNHERCASPESLNTGQNNSGHVAKHSLSSVSLSMRNQEDYSAKYQVANPVYFPYTRENFTSTPNHTSVRMRDASIRQSHNNGQAYKISSSFCSYPEYMADVHYPSGFENDPKYILVNGGQSYTSSRNTSMDYNISPSHLATERASSLFSFNGGPTCPGASQSGRKSVAGEAGSSGYESMRIETSDLSLSHPDSASECSARFVQHLLSKDGYKLRRPEAIRYPDSISFSQIHTRASKTTDIVR